MLASIFVPVNSFVPANLTPVLEIESTISEQCQTLPSLIRAVQAKPVTESFPVWPDAALCPEKASNLGFSDRIPNGIIKPK